VRGRFVGPGADVAVHAHRRSPVLGVGATRCPGWAGAVLSATHSAPVPCPQWPSAMPTVAPCVPFVRLGVALRAPSSLCI
jgi:hypothetical protein